ncbi:MAG TPA: inositol monophosphatase family protein [Marmoricola sp.]|jgi:myo-inositol-1(or 4)-monophosphatase
MTDSADDLLALALDVAAEAAALAVRMRAEGMSVAHTKSSPTDVVTAADRAVEELIRTRLLTARPDDAFLGEEGDDDAGTSGVRWVVDPIDGTVNYLYGSHQYAVSIAAELDGRIVAGVVHRPPTGTVYAVALGGGSTCDGVPLRVRDVVPLEERLVHTGFSYVREVRARQAGYIAALLPRVRDIRRPGSCSLDLCAVAAGEADGYVEEGAHLWDHAAAGLILEEAGGRIDVLRGPSDLRLLAAAPEAGFGPFLRLLEECGFVGNR